MRLAIEAIVITRPQRRSTICGMTARLTRKTPCRLTSMMRSQSSSGWPRNLWVPAIPALLTRMSTGPACSRAVAAMASTWAWSVTSHGVTMAFPPMAAISPARASRALTLRAARTRVAPSAA